MPSIFEFKFTYFIYSFVESENIFKARFFYYYISIKFCSIIFYIDKLHNTGNRELILYNPYYIHRS